MLLSSLLLLILWLMLGITFPTPKKVRPRKPQRYGVENLIKDSMQTGITLLPVSNLSEAEIDSLRRKRFNGRRVYVSCPLHEDGSRRGFIAW